MFKYLSSHARPRARVFQSSPAAAAAAVAPGICKSNSTRANSSWNRWSPHLLYHNIKYHCQRDFWYAGGLLRRDFMSYHNLLMTYLWVVHKALAKHGQQHVQEELFDTVWEETCGRIRAIKVNELSVYTRLGELQKNSMAYMIKLDEACKAQNATLRTQAMAERMKSDLFQNRPEISMQQVEMFAKHIQQELDDVLDIPEDAIAEGRIDWGDKFPTGFLATPNKVIIDENGPDNSWDDETVWREELHTAGATYFWNPATEVAQDARPTGDDVRIHRCYAVPKDLPLP